MRPATIFATIAALFIGTTAVGAWYSGPDDPFVTAKRWSHSIRFASGQTLVIGDRDRRTMPDLHVVGSSHAYIEIMERSPFGTSNDRLRYIFLAPGDQYIVIAKPYAPPTPPTP